MSARLASAAIAVAWGVAAAIAGAQSTGKPYASGNPVAGKLLVEKDCAACHARQYGGDATLIYARPDRRVRSPAQLLAQVEYCGTQLNLQYFPDDEADVAAYLDREHYKFGP